jgi:hypothetical protein
MEWRTKDAGKPTTENIEKWVRKFIDSQKKGEPNFGIADILLIPNTAKVYKQTRSGKSLVAEWQAPKFMLI